VKLPIYGISGENGFENLTKKNLYAGNVTL
jgi:hypothetical protein